MSTRAGIAFVGALAIAACANGAVESYVVFGRSAITR